MRIFKFRAWNPNTNEIISWEQMGDDHWDLWTEFKVCETMMQYTGLRDKNGKEIYEGDIVMFLDRDWMDFERDTKRLPVVYENDAFILKDIKPDRFGEYGNYALFKDYGRDRFEVVGNIYEHKHLLK